MIYTTLSTLIAFGLFGFMAGFTLTLFIHTLLVISVIVMLVKIFTPPSDSQL